MKSLLYPFVISMVLIIALFVAFGDLESSFQQLLTALTAHPFQYTAISFLLLIADIVLPVPSSIVMYMNGYVLGAGAGAAVSFAGLLLGSVAGYYTGRLGAAARKKDADPRATRLLRQYGAMAIVLSRGIPVISESVCIVCGYNRMPLRRYIAMNMLGYLPLCVLYAVFGSLSYSKNSFLISFGLSLALAGGMWLLGRRLFNHQKPASDAPQHLP